MSDVWQPGSEGKGARSRPLSAETGAGVHVNLAFSADRLVKTAVAIFQEQPGLMVLAAVNLVVVAVVPQFVSPVVQVLLTTFLQTTDLPREAVEGLGQLAGFSVSLLLAPVQLLIGAGAMVAATRWVQDEEVDYAALYTSVGQAVRVLIASLVLTVVMVSLYALVIGFVSAVGFAAYSMGGEAAAAGVVGLALVLVFPAVVYIGLGTMLIPYAACFGEGGPIAALLSSWQRAEGARSTLFVAGLIFGVLNLVGTCMCFFPGSLVLAGQYAAFSVAWLRVTLPEAETSSWAFFKRHPEL